jgi:hypothetical protein
LRCQKGGIECSGYQLIPRFVDEIPKMKRRQTIQKIQVEDMRVKEAKRYSRETLAVTDTSPIMCNPLSLIGFRDDIVISFLAKKLAKGRAGQEKEVAMGQSWVLQLPQLSRKSLTALGASFFCYAYQQREVGVAAFKMYGDVLSDMRNCMVREADVQSNGTLATITMMCMFEVRSLF